MFIIANEFKGFLRSLRKKKGLTIVELAEITGLSRSYISQLERGERGKNGVPSPDVLKKISEPLGISFTELMKRAGYIESFKGTFGEYIQSLRKAKGLSVDELSDMSGISVDIIQSLENDKHDYKLSQKEFNELAINLGVTIFDFLQHPQIRTDEAGERLLLIFERMRLEELNHELRKKALEEEETEGLSNEKKIEYLNQFQEIEQLNQIYSNETASKEHIVNIVYENEEQEKEAKEREKQEAEAEEILKKRALKENEIGNLFLFNEYLNYKGKPLTTDQRRLLFEKLIEIMEKK